MKNGTHDLALLWLALAAFALFVAGFVRTETLVIVAGMLYTSLLALLRPEVIVRWTRSIDPDVAAGVPEVLAARRRSVRLIGAILLAGTLNPWFGSIWPLVRSLFGNG